MQFTVRNNAANSSWMKTRIAIDAKKIVLTYKMKPSDFRLNERLMKDIGMPLKAACLYLVGRCKLYQDKSNALIALFPIESDDLLASFITYGSFGIPGSDILKQAFFRE